MTHSSKDISTLLAVLIIIAIGIYGVFAIFRIHGWIVGTLVLVVFAALAGFGVRDG